MGRLLTELIGTYDNSDEPLSVWNRRETVYGVVITLLVLTWIAISFRLYTRLKIIYAPGWDDLFVGLLLITGTAASISILKLPDHGLGKHITETPPEDLREYLRFFWIGNACYCLSTAFVKESLLFQYFRIFNDAPLERRICKVLIVVVALWGTVFSILALVPCTPPMDFLDLNPEANCFAFGSHFVDGLYSSHLSVSISNMILDIIIIYLPVVSYLRGKTADATPLGAGVLFVVGSFVVAISAWRTASMVRYRAATYPTFDPGWYGTSTILLATIEVNLASIAASVPVFWPVLTRSLDMITVTREVKIERSHRFSTINDAEAGDGVEMDRMSRASSQATLRNKSQHNSPKMTDGHYTDQYVKSKIMNPLGDGNGTETAVKGHAQLPG